MPQGSDLAKQAKALLIGEIDLTPCELDRFCNPWTARTQQRLEV